MLLQSGKIDPCLSRTLPFAQVGDAHQLMFDNSHPPGNLAVLVNSPERGLLHLPTM